MLGLYTHPARMDGDKAEVIVAIVPKEVEDACKNAEDECPVTAITIEE